MKRKFQFPVKTNNNTCNNQTLIIRENDFQLQSDNHEKQKIENYSLVNAYILDESDKFDSKILIISHLYNLQIQIINPEDKKIILSKLEEIIKKNSTKTPIIKDYLNLLKEIPKKGKNSYEKIIDQLKAYKLLIVELISQLINMKLLITEKLKRSLSEEFLNVHNDMNTIALEMQRQFNNIFQRIKKFSINKSNKIIIEEGNSSSSYSSGSLEDNNIINYNNKNYLKDYEYLSNKLVDFYNPNYDFKERIKLEKIEYSENLIKEMGLTFYKKTIEPVYVNEPLSMCQKQCEKFFYLNMLTKASKINKDKPLQMCYISAFIIGEIFLNIGRFLKPFTSLLGETFEYYQNYHKFRYYSEQVKNNPQVTAFIGETPDFAYFGDTLDDSSEPNSKGKEINYKNKINVIFKNSGEHYIFNRPKIIFKMIMKPPLYHDYSGTTIIENKNDNNVKCELNFFKQYMNSNDIGNFEGKAYSKKNKVKYLIGGNWTEEIYITDRNGNNKQVLLFLNKDSTYLRNTIENYTLPFYSCNLNFLNDNLENTLPKNDSRFRLDIQSLEKGEYYINDAQIYKNAYEEKRKKELKDEGHEILFFTEKKNEETNDIYYEPNGKYWEWKKNGKLLNNKYKNIFEIKEYLEKEKENINDIEFINKEDNEFDNIENINKSENKIINKYIYEDDDELCTDMKGEKTGKEKLKELIKEKEEKEKKKY